MAANIRTLGTTTNVTLMLLIMINFLLTLKSEKIPEIQISVHGEVEKSEKELQQNDGNFLKNSFDPLSDQDNEVEIEDVDTEGAISLEPVLNTDEVGKGKEINNDGEPTAVAKVYEDPVPSYTPAIANSDDADKTGNIAATSKPGRIKVACWDYRSGEVAPHLRNDSSTENGSAVRVEDVLEKIESEVEEIVDGKEVAIGDTLNRTLEIVNMTYLLHDILYSNAAVKLRSTPSNCSVVMFYATWCPFSSKAAPHFNALPRAYPPLRVAAIDSSKYKNVNTYFGILSVPTVVLFHNGKIIAKFNDTSFTLNKFAEFIEYFSDLKHEERMNVTTKDFEGPLPSVPTKEIDWYLYISWVFIVLCFLHYVSKSTVWRRASDFVRTTWREAEAQHEHID